MLQDRTVKKKIAIELLLYYWLQFGVVFCTLSLIDLIRKQKQFFEQFIWKLTMMVTLTQFPASVNPSYHRPRFFLRTKISRIF